LQEIKPAPEMSNTQKCALVDYKNLFALNCAQARPFEGYL